MIVAQEVSYDGGKTWGIPAPGFMIRDAPLWSIDLTREQIERIWYLSFLGEGGGRFPIGLAQGDHPRIHEVMEQVLGIYGDTHEEERDLLEREVKERYGYPV